MTNKEATYILEDIKRVFATRADGTPYTATYNALNKAIKLLEQFPKDGEWISCNERLPHGQTEVIVSCCDDSGDSKYNYTSFGWMTRDGEYWIVDNEINYYVNAWMPLPEPWKGEER